MKRRLFKISLLVVAGAIVNVAVAWGCATWSESGMLVSGFHVHEADVTSLQAMGWKNFRQSIHYENRASLSRGFGLLYREFWETPLRDPGPARANTILTVATDVCAGWPLFSFRGYETAIDSALQSVRIGAIALPEMSSTFNGRQRLLPITPIALGFTINTLFYAAILWLLFAAPALVRRRRRIKRGLCPACAYPIGAGLICTECGKPCR